MICPKCHKKINPFLLSPCQRHGTVFPVYFFTKFCCYHCQAGLKPDIRKYKRLFVLYYLVFYFIFAISGVIIWKKYLYGNSIGLLILGFFSFILLYFWDGRLLGSKLPLFHCEAYLDDNEFAARQEVL